MRMVTVGPPRTTCAASSFKTPVVSARISVRSVFSARKARVVSCRRVLRSSAEDETLSWGDADGQDRPHPTKTALSKLKKAQISAALQARGLPSEGLKRELVNRLHSALQRAAVSASLTGSGGGGGGRTPLVIAAAALAEAPTRGLPATVPASDETDEGVWHLRRRIVELDAELASFQAQVAAVTAERDADRVKLERLAAGIEEAQTAIEDRARLAELLEAAEALEANEAELDRLRATQAGFMERIAHLQTLLESKDSVIEQLQRQLAEANAVAVQPASHPAAQCARASSAPSGVRSVEVPGVVLTTGAITLAIAASMLYSSSRLLLPPEQRRGLDVATGLFALAAVAYLLHA